MVTFNEVLEPLRIRYERQSPSEELAQLPTWRWFSVPKPSDAKIPEEGQDILTITRQYMQEHAQLIQERCVILRNRLWLGINICISLLAGLALVIMLIRNGQRGMDLLKSILLIIPAIVMLCLIMTGTIVFHRQLRDDVSERERVRMTRSLLKLDKICYEKLFAGAPLVALEPIASHTPPDAPASTPAS